MIGNWETLAVIIALVGLGLPTLNRANKIATLLAVLTERVATRNRQDEEEHEDFRKTVQSQGVMLVNHERRISTLEKP